MDLTPRVEKVSLGSQLSEGLDDHSLWGLYQGERVRMFSVTNP